MLKIKKIYFYQLYKLNTKVKMIKEKLKIYFFSSYIKYKKIKLELELKIKY